MTRDRINLPELAPWAVFLALAVVALFLRLYRLHELAPGLKFDEGWNGIYALQVLEGVPALTFGDKEGLGVYLIALATKFLGRTPLALRLPTALASISTVFVVFLVRPVTLRMGPERAGDAFARPGGWGRCIRSAGRVPWPDHPGTHFISRQLPASLSCTMPGPTVVGMDAPALVGNRAGGRVRGVTALHLLSRPFCSLSVPLFRNQLSAAISFSVPHKSAD